MFNIENRRKWTLMNWFNYDNLTAFVDMTIVYTCQLVQIFVASP